MRTVCPNCQQEYDVDIGMLGSKALCEACNNKFIIKKCACLEFSTDSLDEYEDEDEVSIEKFPYVFQLIQKYLAPDDDDMIKKSLAIILMEREASTSYLQRRLKIGYNRASEIIDKLEKRGIVGPPIAGGSAREIFIFDDICNTCLPGTSSASANNYSQKLPESQPVNFLRNSGKQKIEQEERDRIREEEEQLQQELKQLELELEQYELEKVHGQSHCPYCKESVNPAAVICPHCRNNIFRCPGCGSFRVEAIMRKSAFTKNMSTAAGGALVGGMLLGPIGAALGVLGGLSSGDPSSEYYLKCKDCGFEVK